MRYFVSMVSYLGWLRVPNSLQFVAVGARGIYVFELIQDPKVT